MIKRFSRDRRGSSAVEFALLVIPFLLLLFAVLEYGRLMWSRNAIQQIASETARCMGIAGPNCVDSAGTYSDTRTRALIAQRAATYSVPGPSATLSRTATCSGVSGFSQATLTTTFVTVVPGLLAALAGGIELSATACFPNQG